MEYGFIAGDHPSDEGGHSRENILAGREQSRSGPSTSSTAIAVGEDIHG
jgi:hypothetical protein